MREAAIEYEVPPLSLGSDQLCLRESHKASPSLIGDFSVVLNLDLTAVSIEPVEKNVGLRAISP